MIHPIAPMFSRIRVTCLAASLAGTVALTGCNRAEAPGSPPPAAPATSGAAAPPASAPEPSATPATTPGTPEGAASSLPSSSVVQGSVSASGTAVDSKSTDPKADLTSQEESKGMPEALQGNNHSSTALDGEARKP